MSALAIILSFTLKTEDVSYSEVKPEQKRVIKAGLPEGYKYTVMTEGQYPEGFPKDAVLTADKATYIRGEDTIVGSGARYRIVELSMTDKPDALLALYKTSMLKLGWNLIVTMDQEDTHNLTYKKDTTQFMITVSPSGEGSRLNLTYITAK